MKFVIPQRSFVPRRGFRNRVFGSCGFGRGDDVGETAAAGGIFFGGRGSLEAFAGYVAGYVDVVVGADVAGALRRVRSAWFMDGV